MNRISTTYSKPAPKDETFTPEPIRPLHVPDRIEDWPETRSKILAFDRSSEIVTNFEQDAYVGTVLLQPTTPTTRQTLLLMTPKKPVAESCPGMVIPFYDPDRMAGIDIRTQAPLLEEESAIQFGRHLAARILAHRFHMFGPHQMRRDAVFMGLA